MKYRPEIDGLRAVAVLAVVVHHLLPQALTGGYVGVDVFFVISGYLITLIVRGEMAAGTFTFAGFYERRARRILPALFVVMAATILAAHFILLPSDLISTLRGAIATALFSSNFLFWRDMAGGYFAATDEGLNPLLHTWSLGVEEQFYLLFPLLLMFTRRPLVLALVGVLSILAAALLIAPHPVAVFFLSPFRAWELMAGALLTYLPVVSRKWVGESLSATGAVAIVLPAFAYSDTTLFPGLAALPPVLGAAALIHCRNTAASRVLSAAPMVMVGRSSYSLYLWHWPVIVFARYTGHGGKTLALLAISLALATLSYHLVEKPLRRPAQRTFIGAAGAMALAVVVCMPGLLLRGYEGRVSQEVLSLDRARTPTIPYVQCDGRSVSEACRLGAQGEPSILAWGDSHLLAWAPGLDAALKDLNRAAVMVTVSACPPVFAADSSNAICAERNAQVEHLVQSSGVDTVVLSANWNHYREQSSKLRNTVDRLRATGKRVIVIGPVPTHNASVPLALALQLDQGRSVLSRSTADDQHAKNPWFYRSVAGIELADPITWLCHPWCETYRNGVALYRDAHHLSVQGAMLLAPHLEAALVQGGDWQAGGRTMRP